MATRMLFRNHAGPNCGSHSGRLSPGSSALRPVKTFADRFLLGFFLANFRSLFARLAVTLEAFLHLLVDFLELVGLRLVLHSKSVRCSGAQSPRIRRKSAG